MEQHNIPPVFDGQCKTLILGSFPSVKSREAEFFYAHPQNRFWRVLADVFCEIPPLSTAEKTAFLLAHHIALWDVIASCDIAGSSDSSIRNVVPNDLARVLSVAPVERILCNGTTAYGLYMKYSFSQTGVPAVKLPSTSAANASFSLSRLSELWRAALLPV